MKNIILVFAVMLFGTVGYGQIKVMAPDGDVKIGNTAVDPTEKLDVDGSATFRGSTINVGKNRPTNGGALLNLTGDVTAYPEFGIRLIRTGTGISSFTHRGTNILRFLSNEGGSVQFRASGVARLTINGTGTLPGADDLYNLGSASLRWDNIYATNGVIQTSDVNLKSNIKSLKYGLNEILELRPVIYNWKNKEKEEKQIGLIAQEVEEVIHEVVKREDFILDENDVDGKSTRKVTNERVGMNYTALIPVLINAIQEQNQIVEDQDAMINNLSKQIDELREIIESKNGTATHNLEIENQDQSLYLGQNIPNPTNESTKIQYFIPTEFDRANFIVYKVDGSILLQRKIEKSGNGEINLELNNLAPGIYPYELILNNGQKRITKRMSIF